MHPPTQRHSAAMGLARLVRHALATFLLFGALLATAPAFAQTTKIGYVDLQRALLQVEEGKRVKADLEKEFKAKQKQLDKKQDDLKKLKDQLEGQAMMLSEDAKRQKAMEFQKQMMDLQQLYVQLQGELSKKEAEATKKIFTRMSTIVAAIGKERGYTLILEKTESSVLFAADGMELTDELIRRYNTKK